MLHFPEEASCSPATTIETDSLLKQFSASGILFHPVGMSTNIYQTPQPGQYELCSTQEQAGHGQTWPTSSKWVACWGPEPRVFPF